jgi:hypothetical protein
METVNESRVTHIYIDAAIQTLLLVSFLYNSAIADTNIISAMEYYAFTWSLLTISWQTINALIIKYYFEQTSRDKFLKYFGYSMLFIVSLFAAVFTFTFLEAFLSFFDVNFFSSIYILFLYLFYSLWFIPIFFAVFVFYYYFLTARDIANRFGNTAY